MVDYFEKMKNISWNLRGKETVASRVGKSLFPIGIYNFDVPKHDPSKLPPVIESGDPNWEKYLMNIVGTGVYAGDGKLISCAHVIKDVSESGKRGFILVRHDDGEQVLFTHYPIVRTIRYLDPRTKAGNPDVDFAMMPLPLEINEHLPELPPTVTWGDSTQIGVGDPVIVAGYPHGTDMFTMLATNRGFIQPTFYPGIVSAVIPAMKPNETRIFKISSTITGGISGGAVFNPANGEVLGMVYMGLEISGIPIPGAYVIPSEIIAPYVEAFNYQTPRGRRGYNA